MLHGFDIRGVKSAKACHAIADDLTALATQWRNRASDIEKHRSNSLALDDKRPIIKAARMALLAVNKGANPASACRAVSKDLWVPLPNVEDVFNILHRAQERERRKERNRQIIQARHSGVAIDILARRFRLSKGQISKICSVA